MEGFTFHASQDSLGADLASTVGKSAADLARMCGATSGCQVQSYHPACTHTGASTHARSCPALPCRNCCLMRAALPYFLCQAFSTAGSLKSTVSDPLDDWPDAGPCDGIYTLDNAGATGGEAEPGQGGRQARQLAGRQVWRFA